MTAFIHHLFRALSGYVQKWTKQNIPAECSVLHDFGDGAGPVPAAPVDDAGIYNTIRSANTYELHIDTSSVYNTLQSVNLYELHIDTSSVYNTIVDVQELT